MCPVCDPPRPVPRFQRLCPGCYRELHPHKRLSGWERAALRSLMTELASQAKEALPPLLALEIVTMAVATESKLAGERPPGSKKKAVKDWGGMEYSLKLTDTQRTFLRYVLFACARDYEERTGLLDAAAEHLIRKVMGYDRRTGDGPPWTDLGDENMARLDVGSQSL